MRWRVMRHCRGFVCGPGWFTNVLRGGLDCPVATVLMQSAVNTGSGGTGGNICSIQPEAHWHLA